MNGKRESEVESVRQRKRVRETTRGGARETESDKRAQKQWQKGTPAVPPTAVSKALPPVAMRGPSRAPHSIASLTSQPVLYKTSASRNPMHTSRFSNRSTVGRRQNEGESRDSVQNRGR